MKIRAIILLATAVAAAQPAASQSPAASECDKEKAARAEKQIDAVSTFAQLHQAWQDWKQCDAGTVAELYTDAAFRLLVDWRGVGELAGTLRASPEYRSWLLDRVRRGSEDDRGAIYSRAKTACPAAHESVCAELIKASEGDAPKSIAPLAPLPAPAPAPGGSKK